jgi:hypothetical protein
MKYIARSAVAGAVAVATVVAFGAVTSAQGPNKCLAGKNKCASKAMQGKLKCHTVAEHFGAAVSTACIQKTDDTYTGGAVAAKGCFAKLEAKNDGPCITTGDSTAIGSKGDAFVLDVVQELDPGYPAVVQNPCSAGKKKCVLKKAAAILKCHEKAVKTGTVDADLICLQKARDKFDGGLKPGCFAKLEAKGGCITTGDTAALEAKVDAYTTDVLCELGHTTLGCGPPPSPTPTATPVPGFQGALAPKTTGLFNYNLTVGIPGSDAACNTNFPGSHTCSYAELQVADAANQLIGAMDTASNAVSEFWAIDSAQPDIRQCHNPVAWGYQTAHTGHFGDKVPLTAGHLGALQPSQVCATQSWVGCCI